MEGWQLALIVKPFALVLFFGAIAFFAYQLKAVVPDGKFKDVFFDRTLRNRHPKKFGALVIFLWLGLVVMFWAIGEATR